MVASCWRRLHVHARSCLALSRNNGPQGGEAGRCRGFAHSLAAGSRRFSRRFRVLAAPVPAQERGSNGEVANASVTEKAFRLYRWQEDYSYSYLAGKDRQGWDASWNVVRKVSVADSVYGPVGTLITAKNSTSLDVAQIGQVDVTWSVSRFLQLHALYSHVHAGQYIRSAGGRDFDYYRLQAMFRW